jgi:hypothetical protein
MLLPLVLLLSPAAGFYAALADACETQVLALQFCQQEFEQLPPERRQSISGVALALTVHLDLSKWLLRLWLSSATLALHDTRFSGALAPVAAPLIKLAMQLQLACSTLTASCCCSSSSSSSGGSGSNAHPLFQAVNSALSQAFWTTDCIGILIAAGVGLDAKGQGNAAALQDATSDDAIRLLLVQLAAATEQLYYRQRRKMRKAAAAAPSSSNAAAAAAVDLPDPYHQQLFRALGLPAVDKVRRSNEHLTVQADQEYARIMSINFDSVKAAVMYRQGRQVIEPLVHGDSCSGAAAGSSSSSSSSSRGAAQVPDPAVPAALMRPLLLTLCEACVLDTPLDVICNCCEVMWVLLASSTWLPGRQPPGSSAAAALAAAAQLQQQLGGAAGVQQVLQLMVHQVAPSVIEAHKRGKHISSLRTVDKTGGLKVLHRSVAMQGFGGALISLACSGAVCIICCANIATQQVCSRCSCMSPVGFVSAWLFNGVLGAQRPVRGVTTFVQLLSSQYCDASMFGRRIELQCLGLLAGSRVCHTVLKRGGV